MLPVIFISADFDVPNMMTPRSDRDSGNTGPQGTAVSLSQTSYHKSAAVGQQFCLAVSVMDGGYPIP